MLNKPRTFSSHAKILFILPTLLLLSACGSISMPSISIPFIGGDEDRIPDDAKGTCRVGLGERFTATKEECFEQEGMFEQRISGKNTISNYNQPSFERRNRSANNDNGDDEVEEVKIYIKNEEPAAAPSSARTASRRPSNEPLVLPNQIPSTMPSTPEPAQTSETEPNSQPISVNRTDSSDPASVSVVENNNEPASDPTPVSVNESTNEPASEPAPVSVAENVREPEPLSDTQSAQDSGDGDEIIGCYLPGSDQPFEMAKRICLEGGGSLDPL